MTRPVLIAALTAALAALASVGAGKAEAADLHFEGSALEVSPALDAGAGLSLALAEVEPVMAGFVIPRSKINAVNNLTDRAPVTVRVIDARPLAIAAVIEMGVTDNRDGLAKLRAAIVANGALTADLAAASIAVSAVIGAAFANDGELILFVTSVPVTVSPWSPRQPVLAAL